MRYPLPLTHPPAGAFFEWTGTFDDEQARFLDEHGFIRFRGFASMDEVEMIRGELGAIQDEWIRENREVVNGIPIKWGVDEDGSRFVNRYAFTSHFSQRLAGFFEDPRWETVRTMCGPDFRLGLDEKDGLVVNHYLNVPGSNYTKLGWHIDALRDVFYGKLPEPMWNVGLYLDDSHRDKGALRVIPGTHKQNLAAMFLGKAHFMAHDDDPREYLVEADAGDLTLHDGRLWHRVGSPQLSGPASRRRTMYVPFLNGERQAKDESSKTPFYHRFSKYVR
ncbi:MAG: phytanoyl-CoA dioxygenase family protein [Myxococcales bacterium]|nr:phytanoyl-CoA dioxygenase family protein [Myxococcales bacterium]MCB9531554.1 phytanoyl-CoA dioxygenase family protein [Myxococcales bacterium]MCB9532795.1 phytanoyl-CoA dioxygenase family protein [Myxococcales bacterium]